MILIYSSVLIYVNADKEKTLAIKCNRNKSGVYKWTHRESGKFYIGSSVNLGRRFSSYFSYKVIESQSKFSIICLRSPALLKYGYSEFSLEILEYCTKDQTLKREQFYLDSFKPQYNILTKAGSRLGSVLSSETRSKIRISLTGNKLSEITKSKIKASRIGTKHTEETKLLLK